MIHEAIRKVYPEVTVIEGNTFQDVICKKNNGEIFDIELGITEIQTEMDRLQAEYDAQEYARNRANTYPAMEDQLDYIFHNGIAKWKTDMIAPVKAKYPKPE